MNPKFAIVMRGCARVVFDGPFVPTYQAALYREGDGIVERTDGAVVASLDKEEALRRAETLYEVPRRPAGGAAVPVAVSNGFSEHHYWTSAILEGDEARGFRDPDGHTIRTQSAKAIDRARLAIKREARGK